MSKSRQPKVPSYRLHKSTNQAVVRLNGRDFYLGPWQSEKSQQEYSRLIAEWLHNGRQVPQTQNDDFTVSELFASYLTFADTYYHRNGTHSSEYNCIKSSMRPVAKLYGHVPVRDFGPLSLKTVRQEFVDSGLARKTVNDYVARIKRIFKWGVENELFSAGIYQALAAVAGLRKGRSEARETEPVHPVPDVQVDAIRPYVSRQVWAIVELMRLTGARCGEIVIMRACDFNTTGDIWLYQPANHKTQHHGHQRIIDLGPKAQNIIKEFLMTDLQAYLFRPADAEAEHLKERRKSRKTPVWASHSRRYAKGRAARRRTNFSPHYTTGAVRRSIQRACDIAFPHPVLSKMKPSEMIPAQKQELTDWQKAHRWHPHQLRHTFATRVRKEFGVETARLLLGHNSLPVTEFYAEVDRTRVKDVVSRIG